MLFVQSCWNVWLQQVSTGPRWVPQTRKEIWMVHFYDCYFNTIVSKTSHWNWGLTVQFERQQHAIIVKIQLTRVSWIKPSSSHGINISFQKRVSVWTSSCSNWFPQIKNCSGTSQPIRGWLHRWLVWQALWSAIAHSPIGLSTWLGWVQLG